MKRVEISHTYTYLSVLIRTVQCAYVCVRAGQLMVCSRNENLLLFSPPPPPHAWVVCWYYYCSGDKEIVVAWIGRKEEEGDASYIAFGIEAGA